MKPMTKRFFSLLLAVILLLGLSTSAMAATDSGSTDETTETPVSTTDPTQESDPEEWTEETEPTDPTEPTEEPGSTPELEIHPDPIYEENPFDPEWPYPYGLPVDNDFPADLLEDDPYAIAPYADMSKIPEEMYDSYILRALEYTGYDVQYLKNNGYLFVAQYTSSNLSAYAPQVLSNIGYDDYSPYLNGDETVADATTVSGKAPNIALFESNGLVCASFVSYYWNNYLPNIEGIDTTWVADAVKATTMNNGSYSTASVYAWETGLTNLANTPGSGVTRYTDATTAYANLVPGDVIIFSNSSGKLVHAAIYAGTYTMYNASGTNRGDYHYIIHVGNSRGPEISAVEYMVSAGSKGSTPSAWYHIELPEVQPTGWIEVNKKDTAGKNLSGAYFMAVDQGAGDKYVIGPTNDNGYAKSGELPLGTYVVTETVFPEGYEASGQSSWTVVLTKDTPNMTITINAVNKLKTGVAQIIKKATNGGTLAGWHFTVKDSNGAVVGNYTTDSSGIIALNLNPGTYTVTETDGASRYWQNDPTPTQTITVKAGQTATVTYTNQYLGIAQIVKKSTNGGTVAGWHFTVKDSNGAVVGNYTTDSSGIIALNLNPGTYTVTETDGASQYWQNDPTPTQTITVKAGQTAAVTYTNQYLGIAQIVKKSTNGGTVAGWHFTVKDSNGAVVGNYTTDFSGIIALNLNPGTYTVTETDGASQYWQNDPTPTQTITVKAGQTATVTYTNQYLGIAKIVKTTSDGSSVAGWVFTIQNSSGTFVGKYTTEESGIITAKLEPGTYQITEELPEDSLWECVGDITRTVTVKAGETAEVAYTNRRKVTELTAYKVDTLGAPLPGAVFLLEWSEDGESWTPVTYSDSPISGGCASSGLTDGKLESGKDGIVRFSGLDAKLYYRLTEVTAPNGYQRLTEPAWDGVLSGENGAEVTVVNAPIFELPMTGSVSGEICRVLQIMGASVILTMLLIAAKKRRK